MKKKPAFLVISLIFIITAFFGYQTSKIGFSFEFDSFFNDEDEDLQDYLSFVEHFGQDNNYLLVGIENRKGVFQKDFLQKVDGLIEPMLQITDVNQVVSPTRLKNMIIGPMGPMMFPLMHIEDSTKYAADSTLLSEYQDISKSFFAEHKNAICLILEVEFFSEPSRAKALVESVESMLDSNNFDQYYLAGKDKAEVVYVENIQWDLLTFVSLSAVLIMIFLVIAYRSFWGVLLPMIVVLLAVIWCLGFMSFTGQSLELLSVLIPTIMFVVGMSDVVHIMARYLEELRKGTSKNDAIKVTFKEVGLATFLTSFTTALGFMTLMTASVPPVRHFGLYTGIGVFMAYFIAFTFFPAALSILPEPKVAFKKDADDKLFWTSQLQVFFKWIINHKKLILVFSFVITLISLYGISLIKIDAKLIDELDEETDLRKQITFFEENFAGMRPFEVLFEVPDSTKNIFDFDVLKEMEKVQNISVAQFDAGQCISPLSIVYSLNRSLHGGDHLYYKMPETEKEYKQVLSYIHKAKKRTELDKIVSKDWRVARLSGRLADIGSLEYEKRDKLFEKAISGKVDNLVLEYKVTGSATLIDSNNRVLSENMIQGLAIAFVIISVLMVVIYRSFKVVLIALIPNIIPLLMVASIIGFTGVGLKVSTAIIFTIAFGIAVDDTIHFMSKLRIELSKGKTLALALKRTFLSTGKAIIITSCILVGGFLTMLLSEFNGTFYTGLLVSLTLLFAVLADLMLIPVLVIYLMKSDNKYKKTKK